MLIVACNGTIHGTKRREVYMTLLQELLEIQNNIRAKYAAQDKKKAAEAA